MALPGGERERFGGPVNGAVVDRMVREPDIMRRVLPRFLEGDFPDLDGFDGTVAARMPPAYAVGVMWPKSPEAQRALAVGLAGLIRDEVVPHVDSRDRGRLGLTFNSLMLASAGVDPSPDQLLSALQEIPKERLPDGDDLIMTMGAFIELGDMVDRAIDHHSSQPSPRDS